MSLGDLVEARGEHWIVARSESYDLCTVFALEGCGPSSGRRMTLIAPFDRLRILRKRRLRRRSRQHVLRVARGALAGARLVDGLWTAADARINLLPYQLEPALAVLGGATRVLLADAVGLGKTVQASLILSELRARGFVNRALVLTPAGLRHSWATELRDRFGLTPVIVDQSAITSQSWLGAADVNPWTCHAIIVASIDFVKRPEVLASVEAAQFDLIVADESHHLTPGSDRGAAVERLAARAPWVILASATPHSGDESAFAYLQSLGAHNDRLAIFRRARAEVGMRHSRRICLLSVRPTRDESTMLDAIDRYATAIWRAKGAADPSVQLVAMTLRRRAASSATALLRTLSRRHALLSGQIEPQTLQPSLPWEEAEDRDDDGPDVVLAVSGLHDAGEEQQQLERLLELTRRALVNPSKIHRIQRLTACAREPVVIFTEYRDTVDALASALSPQRALAIIHGAIPIELRCEAIDRFTTGGADVLVATDAAGEGLNLQHRCRLVINVELPWNPLRLEQRIGRVDRIGQTRRVHAVHLVHRNTIEDTVLARLERRRSRAAVALRDAATEWWTERDIASTVFAGAPTEPRSPRHISSTRVPRATDEVARLEAQRAWSSSAVIGGRLVWTPPRPVQSTSRVVWLHQTRHAESCGLTLEHRVDAAVLELARTPATRREWRQLIGTLERLSVAALIAPGHRERSREIEFALRPFREAVVGRLEAIRSGLARSRRRQWQGSLFDRRAELDEERRLDTLDALDAHLARRVELFTHLTPDCEHVQRRLLAVWPLRDRL
ncbi:MAG: helicase-related protein [Vicinamibacterales bacterium]